MWIIFLAIIIIVISIFNQASKLINSILTLSFLPGALDIFDGKMDTLATHIPIVSKLVEGFINWMSVLLINIIDFSLWLIHWIPGVSQVIDFIYVSPDIIERMFPAILGSHRNFITHSIFNPVFVIFLIIFLVFALLSKYISPLKIVTILMAFIGFAFVGHLLADTMPKAWVGFATIKVQVTNTYFVMPPLMSKLWLQINAMVSIALMGKIIEISEISEEK